MKIGIAQMVLERAQFEHRADYLNIPSTTPLEPSDVHLSVQALRPQEDGSNAIVRLIAESAKDALYVFKVSYVALLTIDAEGEEVADLDRRLMVTGSIMLFPFMREVVAGLTSKGRFGPTWLAPVNFNDIVPEKTDPAKLEPVTKP